MRFNAKLLMAGAAALGIAACAPVDPGFGEALRYDMAIQTVDPDPVYPEGGAQPGSNGEVGAKATDRYRRNQTTPVERQTTGGGASGSSGGSGIGTGPGGSN